MGELEASTPDSPEIRQALEVIRRNVELEARLIDDLLDVTRIAKGKLQLSFETVSVHEILQRAYEICREDIDQRNGCKWSFNCALPAPMSKADPARLQQVFWNLIKNSVKFTPTGGRVIIETLNPVAEDIEIRITDTGIGIEGDKIDKIFNAFEQGQSSITRRFGGLGLGLAISKAMVDAHGGKIRVESAGKDKGSTFTLRLENGDRASGRRQWRQDETADRRRETENRRAPATPSGGRRSLRHLHRNENDAGTARLRHHDRPFRRSGGGKSAQSGFRFAHQRHRSARPQRLRANARIAGDQRFARHRAQRFRHGTRCEQSARGRLLRNI